MKIKKFIGLTLQEALRKARAELGDNMILLDSKEIGGNNSSMGKNNLIEITVTDTAAAGKQYRASGGKHGKLSFSDLFVDGENTRGLSRRRPANYVEREQLVSGRSNAVDKDSQELLANSPRMMFSNIFNRMLDSGVPRDTATKFIQSAQLRLNGDVSLTEHKVLDAIGSELFIFFQKNSLVSTLRPAKPQIISLIGPTGAGKTTTIMKMAVNPEIFGQKKVAIITIDNYRMGASEPLKTFSKITSIPVKMLRRFESISYEIERLKNRDVILIDTPGRSPLFTNYISELQTQLCINRPIEFLLVLSATSDVDDLNLSSRLYRTFKPQGVIVTKVDETNRPGKIISMMCKIGLPLSFIGHGQSIPDDIMRSNGQFIWTKILKSEMN